ncbi:MAG: sigma-70 family RNA polymerase sigma factor [Planctomycetota bacterium]|jgi:DNA-directed RNA polymerase specialized sigma24 family protein
MQAVDVRDYLNKYKETRNEDDFKDVVERCESQLRKYLLDQRIDSGDFDELIQEIFLLVFQKIDNYKPSKAGFAWITGIADDVIVNKREYDTAQCRGTDWIRRDLTETSALDTRTGDDAVSFDESIEMIKSVAGEIHGLGPLVMQMLLLGHTYREIEAEIGFWPQWIIQQTRRELQTKPNLEKLLASA